MAAIWFKVNETFYVNSKKLTDIRFNLDGSATLFQSTVTLDSKSSSSQTRIGVDKARAKQLRDWLEQNCINPGNLMPEVGEPEPTNTTEEEEAF